MAPLWIDGHLDLACLAVNGRDMSAGLDACGGPWPPAAVTLPSLREGGVVGALGTIFTELGGAGPEGYADGDAEAAHRRGRAQLEVYESWRDAGLVSLGLSRALKVDAHVGQVRGGMGVAETVPERPVERMARRKRLHLGLLMECADPIRTPDELAWWRQRGVVAVGMAWSNGSRYAGGNARTEVGLTDIGRDFVDACDALGVIHDLTHLSQRATDELLARATGRVIASHSNCRDAFAGAGRTNERHIGDGAVAEIGRRGGVVGVNLVSPFLDDSIEQESGRRATIGDVVRHVERVCDVMGHRAGVALGSDMDGGFSARWLPEGVDTPRDVEKIAFALRSRGWSEGEVEGFRWGNWARVITG